MALCMGWKMNKPLIFLLYVFAQVLLLGGIHVVSANEKPNIEFEQEALWLSEKDNSDKEVIISEKPRTCPETNCQEGRQTSANSTRGTFSKDEARSEDLPRTEGALRQGQATQPQAEKMPSLATSDFGTGSNVQKGNPFQEETPLTIDECIAVAIKNSKDIKISLEKIELAKLKEGVAFRDLFPSLALSWSDTMGKNSSSEQPDYEGSQYGLEAEHEIWPRDFVKYSYKQAGKNLKFNEISHQKTRADLVYDVKKAFYELAKTKEDSRKLNDIMDKALKLRELAEKQKKSDLINQLEYLKAVSRYEELESQKKSQEYLIELAEVKLRAILKLDANIFWGIDEGEIFVAKKDDVPIIDKNEEEILGGYVATALSNRLEIEMQESKLEFYEYGEKAVKGQAKPKISLINSFKQIGDAHDPDEIEYEDEWFVGSKISIPWFGNSLEYSYETGRSVPDRSSTYATANESDTTQQSAKLSILNNLPYYYDRKEAEVAYKSAINEKEEQIKKVIMEVTEAYYTYKNSLNKAVSGMDKLKFAVKQEEITEVLRQLGEETVARSLDVLVELQEAQFYCNQALFEYYVSILELNKSVGKDITL